MSLIQQFLQQNLAKDLGHQLLSKIQQQNSAVETLVAHLQDMRQRQNTEMIQSKIRKVQNYLQVKKQIALIFQPINPNSVMIDWLMNNFLQNSLLFELIKKQQFFMQKQLTQIAKRTLFDQNYLKQHHEDMQFGNKIIQELQQMSQAKNSGSKNRQKIKDIDYKWQIFQEKLKAFEIKVANFNTEILILLRKIWSFEEKIRGQFVNFLKSDNEVASEQQIQQNQIQSEKYDEQKSHLSMSSYEKVSRKNTLNEQIYSKNSTPRKNLDTQTYDPNEIEFYKPNIDFQRSKKPSFQQMKLSLNEKRSTKDGRNSTFENKRSSIQVQQNKGVDLNKRSSIDFRRVSDKYSDLNYGDELQNMNKTLSSMNFYRPEPSSLYTTNDLGAKIRLPTNWGHNSRSSISYYPPR